MKAASIVLAAAAMLPAYAQTATAGPANVGTTAQSADGLLQNVDFRKRRYYSAGRDCTPYNGPYGYYGNPYCEGGFSRYGEAGGYEIDLTRFFDERYYSDRRDRRRWR